MKTNRPIYKQAIVATLSLLGIYLFTLGEFIISSTLFCTAFIASNLAPSDSLNS